MNIRGEYWIEEGDSIIFADGDVGDQNHEGIVQDTARRLLLQELGVDFDGEFVADSDLREAFIATIKEESLDCEDMSSFSENEEAIEKYLEANGYNASLIAPAMGRGDLRVFAVKTWGWKWVRGNNVSTYYLRESDARQIARGYDSIVDQEIHTDDDAERKELDEMEICIAVESTGSRYITTFKALSDRNFSELELSIPEHEGRNAQVEKLDKELRHSCYTHSGD